MDVRFVVDRLAQPPFGLTLSLVTLDEKSPLELLALLNSVLAKLSPEHDIDVRSETPEQTASRIVSFLSLLKYKAADGDVERLLNLVAEGDADTIYSLLTWILRRFADLKTRAYVVHYIKPANVPPEFASDAQIADLMRALSELQREFVEAHKTATRTKSSGFSPETIKREIASLEEDKAQLSTKVARVRRRVSSMPNFEHELGIVAELRKEQEEEISLEERLAEQRNLHQHAIQKYQEAASRLHDLEATIVGGDAQAIVQRQMEELNMNRFLAEEQLPRALANRQRLYDDISAIVNQPAITEADLSDLNRRINETHLVVSDLTARKMESDPSADKNALFRQQAKVVAKKKEAVADELNELMEEHSRAEERLQRLQRERQDSNADQDMLTGEELAQFKRNFRTKGAEAKELRSQMSGLTVEHGILQRTQRLLEAQVANVQEVVAGLEAEMGIEGYSSTKAALEDVTTRKGQINEEKTRTLAEASAMVREVDRQIKASSRDLKPLLMERKQLKAEKRELEEAWQQKKTVYDSVKAGIDSNRTRVESDLAAVNTRIREMETLYHTLRAKLGRSSQLMDRVRREEESYAGRGAVSPTVVSYRDSFSKAIEEQSAASKALQKQKKRIKESHDSNLSQVSMMRNLQRLLDAKVAATRTHVENARAAKAGRVSGAGSTSRRPGRGGQLPSESDRLVIGD